MGGALKTDRPNIKSGFAYTDLSEGIGKVEVRIVGEDSSFFFKAGVKRANGMAKWERVMIGMAG